MLFFKHIKKIKIMQYFEVTIKYESINEQTGTQEKKNEVLICNAVSFTDAEQQAYSYAENEIGQPVLIAAIKRSNVHEILESGKGDTFFKARVNWIEINEKTGKESKKPTYHLIISDSLENAQKHIKQTFENVTAVYELGGISETKISDYVYTEK